MTKPWELLEKGRIDAFDSYKYIFDANVQGAGKTISWISILLNMNRNNALIDNTHELNDEINLSMMYNHNIKIGDSPAIINLFGKYFENISPMLQKERGYPKCMCNFFEDPDYYLKKLNFFPDGWCYYPEKITEEELEKLTDKELGKLILENKKGHCPYVYHCKHKEMIQEAIRSLNLKTIPNHPNYKKRPKHLNINIIWLMVKSYLETEMIDTFLKADKPIGILDENILGLCFEQVTLDIKSIRKFNTLAQKLVSKNHTLKEVWTPFKNILKLISNYLTFDNEIDIEKKAKEITKAISDFLDSFEIDVIVKWNNRFKEAALKNVKEIKGTYNIMDYFIKMLHDNKKNTENFEQNISIDKDTPVISLFISRVEHIRSIVQRFYKLIFTDAMLPMFIKEMTELLQIGDDYEILHNKNLEATWKEIKVLKLNSMRGSYSRNTLLDLTKDNYSDAFYTLIKHSRNIIEFEAKKDRNIGLIGIKKEFKSDVKVSLENIIKKYNSKVYFEHYGNAEGKNAYSDVDWIILFGGYNTPLRVRNIITKIVGIDMEKLEYLYGPGALIQMAHRGRPLLRPGEISLYSLTNEIRGCFDRETDFKGILSIEHENLLRWIVKQGGVTTKEVEEYLDKPNQSVLDILNKLEKEGLVKSVKKSFGRGRPTWFWYIKE